MFYSISRTKSLIRVPLQSRDCDLEVIDIGNNGMSEVGAAHVGKLLAKRDVQEIHVYMNDFGDAGMKALGEALKDRDTLTVLELGGNNIGAEGAKLLAKALVGKRQMKKLDLGYANTVVQITNSVFFCLPIHSLISLGTSVLIASSIASNLTAIVHECSGVMPLVGCRAAFMFFSNVPKWSAAV